VYIHENTHCSASLDNIDKVAGREDIITHELSDERVLVCLDGDHISIACHRDHLHYSAAKSNSLAARLQLERTGPSRPTTGDAHNHGVITDLFATGYINDAQSLLSDVIGGAKRMHTTFEKKACTVPCQVCFNCGSIEYPCRLNGIINVEYITQKNDCRAWKLFEHWIRRFVPQTGKAHICAAISRIYL